MRRLLLTGTLLVLAVCALTSLAANEAEQAMAATEPLLAVDPVDPAIAAPVQPGLFTAASSEACLASSEPIESQPMDIIIARCGFRCEREIETFCAGLSCQGSPAFVPCRCDDGRWRCPVC